MPLGRVGGAALHIGPVDQLQPEPAALAAFCGIAHQQVAVDHQARASAIGQLRSAIHVDQGVLAERAVRRYAHGHDAAAIGWQRRVVALVEQHPVARDLAVVAEAKVRDTAAVAPADVAAHPVVVELVVVRSGAEGHPTRRGRRGRVDLVPVRRIAGDRVVVHVHIVVVQERQLCHAICAADGAINRLHLPDGDAAGECARIAHYTVIGDLQVVVPAVHEDATAALRAVGERDAIDARRVAHEVAREVVAVSRAVCERVADAVPGTLRIICQRPARHFPHALGKHGNGRPFIGPHQRRLHQQFAKIAVERRVPADDGFQRDRVDLALHCRLRRCCRRWAAVPARAAWVVRIVCADHPAVQRHAKQAVHLCAPRIHLAGRMRIGIDDNRRCAHALQLHGLPHQEHLLVAARPDEDQVARRCLIDGLLDRIVGRVLAIHVGRRLAANGDGHGVNRLLAVVRSDDQFAAERRGLASGLVVLLDRATRLIRRQRWHHHLDLRVAPGRDHRGLATDRHLAVRPLASKAVVSRDELLVERLCCRRRAGVAIVGRLLITECIDRQRVQRSTDPRPLGIIADHRRDRRRGIWIRAIRLVVSVRKGLHRHDGRVHVLRLPWHERNLVAELAVGRIIERVADGLARVRRVRHVRIVHAGHHHVRCITGRVGRVNFPGRVGQAVIDAPLVRIQT